MPIKFIESQFNSNNLSIAARQQEQLAYFTESKIQDDITNEYIQAWSDRKFRTDDYFLNFVKSVFKEKNFLLIFKYMRHPLPSARLVNDKIKIPLARVFFSEDSFFKYEINGEIVKHPRRLDTENFNKQMFNALLFRHNDIMVVDLEDINTPFKTLISIDNVIAIDSENSIIRRIAYSAGAIIDDELVEGVLYIDKERYAFFQRDEDGGLRPEPTIDTPHDLGRCPADYISNEAFSDSDVIRKSIFSYTREQLEEYVFLKTMQRMVDPNGSIPVVTKLDTGIKNDNQDGVGPDGEPMSALSISNQRAEVRSTIDPQPGTMQTGTVIEVPVVEKDDGSIDMDVVTNYLNFFFIPTEALEYLNTRIKEIEGKIIANVIGDFSESSVPEGSKSDNEIDKVTIVSRQDVLRSLSLQLSRIRTRSDFNFLGLEFGKDNVINKAFYGSDFFLENQSNIYDMIKIAPNPIEQSSLLIKSARNRNRFNEDNFNRDVLLYKLLPYSVKEDFDAAVDNESVDQVTFQYQTRFNYWIEIFEANFGDIVMFFEDLEGSDSEKLVLIDNLIKEIINKAIVPQQTSA